MRLRRLAALPVRRSLSGLTIVYGSDKRDRRTQYVDLYVRHMKSRRRNVVSLLEIGVGGYSDPHSGGASLRMWRTYFPRAQVVGIDIEPKVIREPRIRFLQCDQSSVNDLQRVAALGPFDVIIDDGSHQQAHILLSFEVLYSALKPGGLYVIEDLQTAYAMQSGGGPVGTADTSLSLAKTLIDEVNRRHIPDADNVLDEINCDVAAVHTYSNIVFIERGGGPDPALNRTDRSA
jgi:trans-aconitate methyltransferase